eukprot:1530900-Pleurochrysis_carterae.AAC.2
MSRSKMLLGTSGYSGVQVGTNGYRWVSLLSRGRSASVASDEALWRHCFACSFQTVLSQQEACVGHDDAVDLQAVGSKL